MTFYWEDIKKCLSTSKVVTVTERRIDSISILIDESMNLTGVYNMSMIEGLPTKTMLKRHLQDHELRVI